MLPKGPSLKKLERCDAWSFLLCARLCSPMWPWPLLFVARRIRVRNPWRIVLEAICIALKTKSRIVFIRNGN